MGCLMDWPTAVTIFGACIGSGAPITAAILKYGSAGNKEDGEKHVPLQICELRHENLDKNIQDMKIGIEKIHTRLDEIILKR